MIDTSEVWDNLSVDEPHTTKNGNTRHDKAPAASHNERA